MWFDDINLVFASNVVLALARLLKSIIDFAKSQLSTNAQLWNSCPSLVLPSTFSSSSITAPVHGNNVIPSGLSASMFDMF
ncbi:hypothetical protein VNO77_32883 [Canavalia gladiata]|uniref:Uncharacterized protein n=1 Tax=Canavalia gladiata TaxID=3824 RepID=A0AAN9KCU8_CANGL